MKEQRFRLIDLMLLIAGIAIGFWLIVPDLRAGVPTMGPNWGLMFMTLILVLGGLSLVGPPLLVTELRRRRRPWGAGKVLWFSHGMSAWLLWPPIIYRRAAHGAKFGESNTASLCFAYGTPLMALYVTAALLAGGWLRRRRRRRLRSWRERFGLILGLAWACTGLYVLYLVYTDDFK